MLGAGEATHSTNRYAAPAARLPTRPNLVVFKRDFASSGIGCAVCSGVRQGEGVGSDLRQEFLAGLGDGARGKAGITNR